MANRFSIQQRITAGGQGIVVKSGQRAKQPVSRGVPIIVRQDMGVGRGGQLSTNTQQTTINQFDVPELFFVLHLAAPPDRESADHFVSPQSLDTDHLLGPGRTYRVYAIASPTSSGDPRQRSVRTARMPELRLTVLGSARANQAVAIARQLDQTSTGLALDDLLDGRSVEFTVAVSAECPREDIELALYPQIRGPDGNLMSITTIPCATLKARLDGTYNPPDEPLWNACHVDPTQPPENVALIHVEVPTSGKVKLHCWSSQHAWPLRTEPLSVPAPWLGTGQNRTTDPKAVRNALHAFSSSSRTEPLRAWLLGLLERYPDDCQVVVIDEIDSEVPWEMLEIDPDQYLGVRATVARWTAATYFKRATLVLQDEELSGSSLAFVDTDESDQAMPTHRAFWLRECQLLKRLAVATCGSVDDVRQQLAWHPTPIGLLYLSCQGIFTSGREPDSILDLVSTVGQRRVVLDLIDVVLPEGVRPVVFVNAPHSARPWRANDEPVGLVNTLLAKYGGGYIGTLGPVRPDDAHDIARAFLEAVHAPGAEVKPAEFLQEIRRRAADSLRKTPAPSGEDYQRFVSAFTYVYYGNPAARLRLTGSAAGDQSPQEHDDGR